jgi:hypothetical protein
MDVGKRTDGACPAKPIRMLSAHFGGGSDIAARLIAGALSPRLGHQVVVDSRVGGTIIAETAVRATPDGYTIICYSGTLWLLLLMQPKPAYDPFRDFAPITLTSRPSVHILALAFLTHHPGRKTTRCVRDGIATSPAQFPYHRGSRLSRVSSRASHVPRRSQWLSEH